MIRTHSVTKSYGTTVVVDDVSLAIPRGGVTALIGGNGAGKSTLLAIMARLLRADGGTVSVDGIDVRSSDTRELARRLAILRQDNHLAVRLTVWELVSFGRHPHSGGHLTARDHRIISRAIERLDLSEFASRHLDELSGGQRQRAFVAMVLAQETDYILLDEPLNNLDMRHAISMMRLLKEIAAKDGRTCVVVVHDVNIAATFADHLVAMRDGKIVCQGEPAELVNESTMSEVFSTPVRVAHVDGRPVCLYTP